VGVVAEALQEIMLCNDINFQDLIPRIRLKFQLSKKLLMVRASTQCAIFSKRLIKLLYLICNVV